MRLYFDTAYVAKFYLNEPDSQAVVDLVEKAEEVHSSEWCLAEMACVLHRQVREGALSPRRAAEVRVSFRAHVAEGGWSLVPVTRELLEEVDRAVHSLSTAIVLRAGDALHLVSAQAAGFSEIWSNDRRLLRAARHFGLRGRSV